MYQNASFLLKNCENRLRSQTPLSLRRRPLY